jgi:hypothetical protein
VDHNFSFFRALDKFEENLTMCPEEKELFSKSCFGQFLKQPKIIKSSKIINHLLMMVGNFDGIKSHNALYIEIDGVPRAFKGKQYAEIVNLRYIDDYTHCDYQTNIEELQKKFTRLSLASKIFKRALQEPF